MAAISMFFGIVIQMFSDDHNPPHFHARYQGYRASFDLDGNLREGAMPRKQQRLITAWTEIHREELEENWKLIEKGEALSKIDPLR